MELLTSAGVMSLVSWLTSTTILADEISNRLLTVADIRQSQLSQYIDILIQWCDRAVFRGALGLGGSWGGW